MTEVTKEIAKITSTHLGFEDHGIFTAMLHVTYGGAGQGVGGYAIAGMAGEFITSLLRACGVDRWEKLVGRTVYVLSDGRRRVVGVENLPTEPGGRFLFADVMGEPS